MKFLSRLLLLCIFGWGSSFAQTSAPVINASSCEKPAYPSASKRLEEEGTVQLKFLVDVDGKVIESVVEKSSGFRRLDEAAREGLSKCAFKPPIKDGVALQSWASIKYEWRLGNPICVGGDVSKWTSCLGTLVTPSGGLSVVEYTAGKKNGRGIEYDKTGKVIRAGIFEGEKLVSEQNLNPKSYPFDRQLLANSANQLLNTTVVQPNVLSSNLPLCPSSTSLIWHNCVGERLLDTNLKYVGTFRDNNAIGEGVLYRLDESVVIAGNGSFSSARNGNLSVLQQTFVLRANDYSALLKKYPFNSLSRFSSASPTAQPQTSMHMNQNFQSITTTLKNSNSWAFIVDQSIELEFNPQTEVISFDLKKVLFQLNPSQFENYYKGLRGKVCKLEISISKVLADGTWSFNFPKQTISIADKFEPEPNKFHEVVVPPSSLKFPTSLLNEKTNQYRITLEIYTERPRLAGSPCDASVPIHTPYLNNYLLDQVARQKEIDRTFAEQKVKEQERLADLARRKEQQRSVNEAFELSRLRSEAEEAKRIQAQLEEQLRLALQKPSNPSSGVSSAIGKRIALVVGNANYKVRPLKNSLNDADDISRSLKATGFDVIDLRDATLPQMRSAVRQFGDRLVNNDVGLVYYSGHGVEVKGRNYFIPVNADIQREDEIADQGLDVSLILEKMSTAGKGVNILIVDACRDDPFGRSFRSSSRGLAQMDAPRGTIIAYATSPGKVASDGDPRERNSPYTKHLVRAMQSPNKPIEQVFKEVRRAVQDETKNQQTPWENTSLSGDFYFKVAR
jgi:TonB family protein